LGYKIKSQKAIVSSSRLEIVNPRRFMYWIDSKKVSVDNGNDGYLFTIKKKDNCSDISSFYYKEATGQRIYLYCLNDILVNFKDSSISLKKLFSNNDISMNKISDYLELTEGFDPGYYDGSKRIYKDFGANRYSKLGFTVLYCSSVEGNGKVYIGPLSMEYKKELCTNN
jgi:hypothetical protein